MFSGQGEKTSAVKAAPVIFSVWEPRRGLRVALMGVI